MTVDRNIETSKQMLGFAWGLEILLCVSGVLTALVLAYIGLVGDSDEPLSAYTWAVLLTGALPLIAIALSELIKIPLTKGLVRTRSYLVKCISFTGLALVCWLTFDTMMMSQENFMDTQQKGVNESKRKVNSILDDMKLIEEKIVALNSQTPEDIRITAYAGVESQLQEIKNQIDDLEQSKELLSKSMNPAEIGELKRQILAHERSIERLEENKRTQLKNLNEELKQINFNEQNELENVTFGKGRIKEHYSKLREDIKIERSEINDTFKVDLAKINKKITTLNNKVTKLSIPDEAVAYDLSLINKQLSEANQNRLEIRQKVDQEINNDIALWEKKSTRIDELKLEKAELGEELNQHREVLESGSSNSFIHRMAGIYYGVDNLADLTEEQIGIFKLIFMISVATVVSTTGPILTYVALNLQKESEGPQKSKVLLTLRKMLVDLRQKLRNPKVVIKTKEIEIEKEVIKEVPVEKIIYEKVIKPEPFEVPKYVQVPVPTDAKDFPEMADLRSKKVTPISSQGGA